MDGRAVVVVELLVLAVLLVCQRVGQLRVLGVVLVVGKLVI